LLGIITAENFFEVIAFNWVKKIAHSRTCNFFGFVIEEIFADIGSD